MPTDLGENRKITKHQVWSTKKVKVCICVLNLDRFQHFHIALTENEREKYGTCHLAYLFSAASYY